MKKIYARSYQFVFKIVSNFLKWRKPEIISGVNSLLKLPNIISANNINCLLIVTDKGIVSLGLMNQFLEKMDKDKLKYVIYDKTVPNPTIDNIEEARELYLKENCDAILGFGGGTAMDCAKAVGARIARPNKSIQKMKGELKIGKKIPFLITVPTTAGTGSEATLAAVVTDSKTHEKYAINDPVLIPNIAVHDPILLQKLPKNLTSTTGMDALTHAIEAYIGRSNTKETKEYAIKAVKIIFRDLENSYNDGNNLILREHMLKASYYAGIAFTRAYVGNIHAMAHTLGGFYQVPHGYANAIIMPYVLDYYGESAEVKLAELAKHVEIGQDSNSDSDRATKFIETIKLMNNKMGIPDFIIIPDESNLEQMVDRAYSEAFPLYPVPKIFDKKDFEILFRRFLKYSNEEK
ncbi:MAG TPA: iron-containing alcohol dehydrogenase [Acholeplasmataceae bacterium]|nr:iron-containing alcohol dehydrogenase [Acholeplasmataceae bacterium]